MISIYFAFLVAFQANSVIVILHIIQVRLKNKIWLWWWWWWVFVCRWQIFKILNSYMFLNLVRRYNTLVLILCWNLSMYAAKKCAFKKCGYASLLCCMLLGKAYSHDLQEAISGTASNYWNDYLTTVLPNLWF